MFSHLVMAIQVYVCDKAIYKYIPDSPGSRQLLADLNGALINSDTFLDYPRLLPESFLHIGGMQIAKKNKPLPKVIKDFVDGAEHGVIIFIPLFTLK